MGIFQLEESRLHIPGITDLVFLDDSGEVTHEIACTDEELIQLKEILSKF
jgi:hypothetical protein